MSDQQPVVSQRAQDAAEETEKLLYAHHVIKYDGDAALRCARHAFAKFEAETTAEVEKLRDALLYVLSQFEGLDGRTSRDQTRLTLAEIRIRAALTSNQEAE